MRNPFQFGDVVTGETFCNRQKEKREIKAHIENNQKLFLYSERRLGKTSLIKEIIASLPKTKRISAYVDLYPTDGQLTFASAMAEGITRATSRGVGEYVEKATQFFKQLRPSISFDSAGNPKFNLELSGTEIPERDFEEILDVPAKLAANSGKEVLIVFDEFQQVAEYGSDYVERKIRSVIQHHDNVAYIFMGSKKHLIKRMFLEKSSPLYRSAKQYSLGPISLKDWTPFISEKFTSSDKAIDTSSIEAIIDKTEGHPFYTQHLCYELWEMCPVGSSVDAEMIEEAVTQLLAHESTAFTAIWETCTMNQRRLLKTLALEPFGVQIYSSEIAQRYRLGTASSTQRSINALIERDILDTQNGGNYISDRFFRLWIQKHMG